jgi:xanthine dehydrogenase YagR molybdenum-binding subunit
MAHDLTRRSILGGTIALGALGYRGGADHARANPATPRGGPMSTVATRYIGTSTSRVDGRAKVTGAAKYAAEFNVPNLAYGYVLTSRIARGRIARVDTSAALRVPGVLDVLSHAHRPEMAGTDAAYNDDAAPPGSPYRPLYDDRIWFSGQPVALILADEWETARFAASLVRVDYIEEEPATDIYRQAGEAFPLGPDTFSLHGVKPRGDASRALAAADVRHAADYYVPMEHHNPMELYASTVVR